MQRLGGSSPVDRTITIVSGGQAGVDRAALDVAIEFGFPYRGWCPKVGWAEDMPNPCGVLTLYPSLRETSDSDPRQRTEWNVCDSDRLLVLVDGARLQASKGTVFAVECAVRFGKPHVVINLDDEGAVARGQSFPRRGAGSFGAECRRSARKRSTWDLHQGRRILAHCVGPGLSEPESLRPVQLDTGSVRFGPPKRRSRHDSQVEC